MGSKPATTTTSICAYLYLFYDSLPLQACVNTI